MKLVELASTIRSKNAGVDHITFDVICRDRQTFERVRDSGALTRAAVARLYGVDEARVTDFVVFEPANASSPSAACSRAAAWARATCTARSSTRRCSTSRSPEARAPGREGCYGFICWCA